ncbi:MAG: hypothetical protein ACE37K_06680 [Planctomycetota bacterium]
MTNTSRRDAYSARVMLRRIGGRDEQFGATIRERIDEMMAFLDAVILRLPDDPPDDMVEELERVVTTLSTADASLASGNSTASLQMIDLARARLERFVRKTPSLPDPNTAT